MKKMILLLLLLAITTTVYSQPIESFDVVQRGYWRVVLLGDTLPGQYDRYDTALKRAYDAARDSTGAGTIQIIPPEFTFHFNKEAFLASLNYETMPDTLRRKSIKDYFYATIETPNPDTLGYYDLVIRGVYEAESVNIATTCYDGEGRYQHSGEAEKNNNSWTWRRQMQCNGILTYWIMPDGGTDIGFVDIAHRRYIGKQ